jgi:hypothetical protein
MSAAALMLSALVAAGSNAQPAADGDRAPPIRCRPAPYYVNDPSGLPPRRALQDAERRVRSCYLVTVKKKALRVLV